MSVTAAIPALADLSLATSGRAPVEILQRWAYGVRDAATAEALLQPFAVEGTAVASDTAGLSRMTRELELWEVVRIVSLPKQIVHALGTAVGGRAIGRWVADNTLMFYPPSVAIATVLDAMNEAQARIAQSNPAKIGLCVHPGLFYELGEGLHGADARLCEVLAESHAGPGEILLTQRARDALAEQRVYAFRPRVDLAAAFETVVFSLVQGRRMADLVGTNVEYPHDFSPEAFRPLVAPGAPPDLASAMERVYASSLCDRAVLFVTRAQRPVAAGDLAAMLDGLLSDAIIESLARRLAPDEARVLVPASGITILVCSTVRTAFALATELRERAVGTSLPLQMGIDCGPILLFESHGAVTGVTGDAVNTASKLSEDVGEVHRIAVTTRALRELDPPPAGEPFAVTVSNVALTGVKV
jgi:hypothetical protein